MFGQSVQRGVNISRSKRAIAEVYQSGSTEFSPLPGRILGRARPTTRPLHHFEISEPITGFAPVEKSAGAAFERVGCAGRRCLEASIGAGSNRPLDELPSEEHHGLLRPCPRRWIHLISAMLRGSFTADETEDLRRQLSPQLRRRSGLRKTTVAVHGIPCLRARSRAPL
jgi:hypothetical protein